MQALRQLEVAANTRLLITGASGVTGAIAVQLAAELSATIVAIAAAGRAQRLVGFGAAQVIDSHEADWADRVEGEFDAALVAVRDTSAAAMTLVRDGGRLCSITSDAPPTVRGIDSTDLYVRPDADQLTYLADRCAAGRVELYVSSVALVDAPSVAQRVIAGQSGGRKYVLSLAHW
jgi:NADPH:quinone reductase-like Zn-dependent oxidoreductase